MVKEKTKTIQGNKPLSVMIISFIYSIANELSSEVTFATTSGSGHINFAIFVPASAAILFGQGVGAASAGIGGLLTEIQRAVIDNQGGGLDYNTIISSLSNALGAYMTGFLTKVKEFEKQTLQESLDSTRNAKQILNHSVGALVGMSLVGSFTDAYAQQIKNGEPITDASRAFLGSFFASAIVIVFSIPLILFLFDKVEEFLIRRGITADTNARNLTWEVSDPGDAEIESVELPEHAFLINTWTAMKFKFKNKTGRETAFTIECVSTAQVYPNSDKSKVLQPDESWEQEFFILPGQVKSIDLRVRVTPFRERAFKAPIADDSITEISGKVLDPNKNSIGLTQFGGVNFSVVGISIVWQDIVDAVHDPGSIIKSFAGNTVMIGLTALVETLVVLPALGIYYKYQKSKKPKDSIKLAFSQDLESHGYQEIGKKKFMETVIKYQKIVTQLIRFTTFIATVASIGYIGYEGYRVWENPDYVVPNPEYIFYGAVLVIGLWVFSMYGLDLLSSIGMKTLPPWALKPGEVILDFKPLGQFQEGIATEVIVMAQNPTDKPGLRIVFQGQDTVTPPMVEIHANPGEIVNFKIAVTPIAKNTSDTLAIAYPFFDNDGKLLDFEESEPVATQEINYVTYSQTKMGMTQDQQKRVFQVAGVGAAFGILVTFIQQLFPDYPQIAELIKQSGPYLAALQAPFIYGYFYVQNKLGSSNISM